MTRKRFPRLLAVFSHVRVAYEQTRPAVRSRTFCVLNDCRALAVATQAMCYFLERRGRARGAWLSYLDGRNRAPFTLEGNL